METQQAVISKNEVTINPAVAKMLADNFNTDGTLKMIKMELWCQYWVNSFDEMEACMEAGYKQGLEKNPSYHKGLRSAMMRKPHIQLRVKNLIKERVAHLGIDENWVIMNVVKVMNHSIGGTPIKDRKGEKTGAWMHDSRGSLKALEMLGNNMGMFQKKEKTREVRLILNFGGNKPVEQVRVEVETGFSERHEVIDVEPMRLD